MGEVCHRMSHTILQQYPTDVGLVIEADMTMTCQAKMMIRGERQFRGIPGRIPWKCDIVYGTLWYRNGRSSATSRTFPDFFVSF